MKVYGGTYRPSTPALAAVWMGDPGGCEFEDKSRDLVFQRREFIYSRQLTFG